MGVKISEMTELPVPDLADGDFTVVARAGTEDNYKVDLGAFSAALISGALLSANNLDDVGNAATSRANLGLQIGVDVMAFTTLYYRVGAFFVSTPTASETLVIHAVTDAFTFPANFTGSRGSCGINPTSSFVMTVYQNPTFTGLLITGGTAIGTITVSTGGVFTFATTGGTAKSIAATDTLGIAGPAVADATAAALSATLKGTI